MTKNNVVINLINRIKLPDYTKSEELINSISHGIAFVFSMLGLIPMILKAKDFGSLSLISSVIFGIAMVLLYLVSAIYHYPYLNNLSLKKIFRVIDHCNVFLLVLGTIMPVALLGIAGRYGVIFFSIVFIITLIGIFFLCINIDKFQFVEVLCHLINGWSILIFLKFLILNIGYYGVLFIILGGIMYSLGSILYFLGSKRKYFHSIFHFFCILGTLFHYIAIYFYLLV